MEAGLVSEMLATDLADYLVRRGVPFRETHHVAGQAVQLAEENGVPLSSLTTEQVRFGGKEGLGDVCCVWELEGVV